MDPNPIKHIGSLVKFMRTRIEPPLLARGFTWEPSPAPPANVRLRRLDYRRGEELICCTFHGNDGYLLAEMFDGLGDVQPVAFLKFEPFTTMERFLQQIDDFLTAVVRFVESLPDEV